jgi:Bifunctional DNA primase/polymerase, N-terminal/YspA, cpYpsA-related SLOG family
VSARHPTVSRTILVTGARDWSADRRVAETLDRATKQAGGEVRLLVGDAPGADAHARAWAEARGVPVEVFPARWAQMAAAGKPRRAAGPERNRAMLDRLDHAEGQRLVVAFHEDLDGRSRGTRHCAAEARRRGYPVALVTSAGRTLLPPRPDQQAQARALRTAALGYAAHGIPVLPLHTPQLRPVMAERDQAVVAVGCSCGDQGCDRPGKHPRTLLVPHGVTQATRDPERVEGWWRRAPLANIGLATGHTVDVLDLDGPLGVAALRAFAADHGWMPTGPLVRTGRGWHLYLQPSGTGPRNPIHPELLAHVDWRGKGAYAIAPPSRHAYGAYTWVRGLDTPLEAAPPALLALLRPRRVDRAAPLPSRPVQPGHPYGQAALDRECRELAAMPPDSGRNRRLFDAGLRLYSLAAGGVLDEEQVERELLKAADRCGLLATEAKATRLTLASARRIGMAHPRGVPEHAAGGPPTPPAQRTPATRERGSGGCAQQSARLGPERG